MNKHKYTQAARPADAPDNDDDATSRLIRPEIIRIFGARPLMPHEDPDKFDALLTELILSYDPRDTIEYILIKDLADAQWQSNRYRSMRQSAIQLALPDAAWQMLEGSYIAMRKAIASAAVDPAPQEAPSPEAPQHADKGADNEKEQEQEKDDEEEDVEEEDAPPPPYVTARPDITRLIRHSMQGDTTAREELEAIMAHAGVTYDMLHTSALLTSIKSISALEEMLIHADKRRDQLMGMIQARRHVNDVMAKSLLTSRKQGHADDDVEDQ